MFARFVWALFALTTSVSVVLNAYIRLYPLIRTGCSWEPDAAVKITAFGDPQIAGWWPKTLRKRLDIAGNDLFLQQIVNTVRRITKPDFVTVMGDLISSQWIPTTEFDERADRFAKIFPSGPGKLVNVTGNHDIGYHGEINQERIDRYVRRYGPVNYVVHATDTWRLVVLNSLALDGPPYDDDAQQESKSFLADLKAANFKGSTVLLTHIPMYKEAGICRDGPHFEFYGPEHGSGLRSQNHLSAEASDLVLNSVFGGSGTGGIILTGHDHEGCETSYLLRDGEWISEPGFSDGNAIKEATVRSVMGEYGGNAGLVSGVWDAAAKQFKWHFSLCRFHVQHIWWATQVTTYVALILFSMAIVV